MHRTESNWLKPKQKPTGKKPMGNYKRGAAFENWLVSRLRAGGYFATRTAGSHGIADVWAARGRALDPAAAWYVPELVLVQAKSGPSAAFTREDWNELWETCTALGAVPVLAERPKKGSAAVNWWRLLDGRPKARTRASTWPRELWAPGAVCEKAWKDSQR